MSLCTSLYFFLPPHEPKATAIVEARCFSSVKIIFYFCYKLYEHFINICCVTVIFCVRNGSKLFFHEVGAKLCFTVRNFGSWDA